MSYDTDRYGLKKLANQSLCVVECGIQICHAGHAAPQLTYQYYSAHFILEGKGVYILDGKSYPLSAGQGFMITPGANCTYVADQKQPWKYVYASFSGTDDQALVHNAGLDEENVVFEFPLDEAMVRDIYAMHAAGKINEAKGYDVTGYFLLCMSRLVKANLSKMGKISSAERYVKKACAFIEDHYPDKINVADMAAYVGLDRTYFYRLFQKYKGCSPSQYLLDYRLNKAAEMLGNPTLPIAEIGAHVGFCDTAHFYRAFSRRFQMPPKKYRMEKGEAEDE